MGKNIGDDLAEGKPTLPLIRAMQHGATEHRALLRKAIEDGGREHAEEIIRIVGKSGALEYTHERAVMESTRARAALKTLPASPYLEALKDLAEFAVTRRA